MEESSLSLRERTYNATTTVQEFIALFKGLSQRIMHLSVRVKDLRACLIVRIPQSAILYQKVTILHTVHKRERTTAKTSRRRWPHSSYE